MTLANLKRGIEIVARYVGEDETLSGAEHDVIFLASSQLALSDDDRVELIRLGFRLSDHYDCWCAYA